VVRQQITVARLGSAGPNRGFAPHLSGAVLTALLTTCLHQRRFSE